MPTTGKSVFGSTVTDGKRLSEATELSRMPAQLQLAGDFLAEIAHAIGSSLL